MSGGKFDIGACPSGQSTFPREWNQNGGPATVIGAFDGTVESVHPLVQTGKVMHGSNGYRLAIARKRTPADYEDLDALSIEEQAAIVCAIFASGDSAPGYDRVADGDADDDLDSPAWHLLDEAVRTGMVSRPECEVFGDCEARIRTGQVRR